MLHEYQIVLYVVVNHHDKEQDTERHNFFFLLYCVPTYALRNDTRPGETILNLMTSP